MPDWFWAVVVLLVVVGLVIHVLRRKGDDYIQDDPDD